MITTKLYLKLILILPFFLSLSSLASDSLKVKKTEYYEDGKLVRAIYYDDKYSMKVKEIFIGYTYGFEGRVQNNITLIDIENGKYVIFKTYHANIIGDSVFFYNPHNLGAIQKIKYDSNGKKKESIYNQYYLKSDSIDYTFSLNDIDKNLIDYKFPLKIKYLYDSFGNIIEDRWINNNVVTYRFKFVNDSLGRILKVKRTRRGQKTWSTTEIKYENAMTSYVYKDFDKKKMFKFEIKNFYYNDKEQELKIKKYNVPLKKSKPIGEPKLTFTQENIYENDRIVKIIYEDILLGKKKVHELKYEFY